MTKLTAITHKECEVPCFALLPIASRIICKRFLEKAIIPACTPIVKQVSKQATPSFCASFGENLIFPLSLRHFLVCQKKAGPTSDQALRRDISTGTEYKWLYSDI